MNEALENLNREIHDLKMEIAKALHFPEFVSYLSRLLDKFTKL